MSVIRARPSRRAKPRQQGGERKNRGELPRGPQFRPGFLGHLSMHGSVLRARQAIRLYPQLVDAAIKEVISRWGDWKGKKAYSRFIHAGVLSFARTTGLEISSVRARQIFGSVVVMPDKAFEKFAADTGHPEAGAIQLPKEEKIVFPESAMGKNEKARAYFRHELAHWLLPFGSEVAAYALSEAEFFSKLVSAKPGEVESILERHEKRIAHFNEMESHGLEAFTPKHDYERDRSRGIRIAIQIAKITKTKGRAAAREYCRQVLREHGLLENKI